MKPASAACLLNPASYAELLFYPTPLGLRRTGFSNILRGVTQALKSWSALVWVHFLIQPVGALFT